MSSVISIQNTSLPIGDFAIFKLPSREARKRHTAVRPCKSERHFDSPVGKRGKPISNNMEELLIAVATSQDREAFHSLFNYFAPRVKSYLQQKGTSPELAEEAVQEAMMNVWRKASQFDPQKASASTWIFAIARNTRIDLLRKTIRPELDPNDPSLVPDPSKSAVEIVSASEEAEQIRSSVALLPHEQQEVLRLAFFEDIAHTEIARKLNIPLGTVKSRIRLAVQRIRSEIGEHK